MKKTFIIECDSNMSTVFLYEAKTECRAEGHVAVRGEKIVNEYPTPKFYGILDSLIITDDRMRARFANVKPIVPMSGTLTEDLTALVEKAEAKCD
jgi:hypothetical protein